MSEILENEQRLRENEYPGRGIIQGMSPDTNNAFQIYWLMGRSDGSRNRLLKQNGDIIHTAPFEDIEGEDHSLTIYNAMRSAREQSPAELFPADIHVVSNGHQTDSIFDEVLAETDLFGRVRAFGRASLNWGYEPDNPNFTPRISGMMQLQGSFIGSQLSIIKRVSEYGEIGRKSYANDFSEVHEAGQAVCVHTYDGNGEPIPSFSGEPYKVGLENSAKENAEKYAEILAGDNFVSLVAKAIPLDGSESTFHIINKNQK